MSDVPNLGQAGAVLDATNTGLVAVDKAIWMNEGQTAFEYAVTDLLDGYSVDIRFDVERTTAGTLGRLGSGGPAYLDWNNGGEARFVMRTDDGGGIYKATAYFDITPYTEGGLDNGRVQLRGWFDSAQSDLVLFARAIGPFLSDDAGWTELGRFDITGFTSGAITQNGYAISQGTLGLEGIVYGFWFLFDDEIVIFDAAVDLPPDPAATSFVLSTGEIATVVRAASGPVTVLAPGPVLVNPDDTDALIFMSMPIDAAFAVAANEDAIIGAVLSVSNEPVLDFRTLCGIIDAPHYLMTWQKTAHNVFGAWNDGGGQIAPNTGQDMGFLAPFCIFSVLNRATNTVAVYGYDTSGLVGTNSNDATALGAIIPTTVWQVLTTIPGTWQSAVWHKGVGIAPSDETLAQWAAFLLTRGVASPTAVTTGKYPPVNPYVGDHWTATNGHSAIWSSTGVWVAQFPLVDNICVLLGNSQLWIGADTP